MKLISYPLNGITYDAQDVGTYLCTRTSGVYSRETNFAVSVTGAREITVSPGLAWINYDDFKGISVCARESGTLTIPDADDIFARIDRVVLQFDSDANQTTLKLKTGTPEESPAAPEIQQNHRVYELCIAEISVPAGSTSVTAADITDTRLDESLCGVMRDGVEGIPTGELLAKWQAAQAAQEAAARKSTADLLQALQASADGYTEQWDTAAKAMQAETAKLAGGSFYTRSEVDRLVSALCSAIDLTLAADGWAACTEEDALTAGLAFQYDAAVTGCTEALDPHATIERASRAAAQAAGLDGICQTMDGICRFYAAHKPTTDISLRLVLLGAKESEMHGTITTALLGEAVCGNAICGM